MNIGQFKIVNIIQQLILSSYYIANMVFYLYCCIKEYRAPETWLNIDRRNFYGILTVPVWCWAMFRSSQAIRFYIKRIFRARGFHATAMRLLIYAEWSKRKYLKKKKKNRKAMKKKKTFLEQFATIFYCMWENCTNVPSRPSLLTLYCNTVGL